MTLLPTFKVLLGTALFSFVQLSAAQVLSPAAASSHEGIVAQVEDDVILRSELDGALARIRGQYAGKENQLPPAEILERQVLERLIANKLQVLRAEETGVQVTDTEIDQAIARVADSNKLTPAQLQAALAKDGIRLADFRGSLREEILVQKLRGRVAQSRSDVSESEIDIAMASAGVKKGELKLAHILIEVPDNATSEQIELAKKKIDGVRKLVSEGKMEFSAAAIRYSNDPQALEGGVIGWRRYDQIPPGFTEALAGLKAGDMSQPVRSQAGLHVLKVLEVRDEAQVMVTEYHARHILINVDELTSDAEAEKTARAIYDQIKTDGDFSAQAKKYSNDAQTAALGGDMGWFDIQTYGTTYAETINALKDNEVSQPFRTEQGWHVLKREGTRQLDRTKEYERLQVRDNIRQRKSEDAYQAFLRQLRNESFVENRLEKTPDALAPGVPEALSPPDADKPATPEKG
jgi:peptidyl-prolyl cis-trans isomerase SurA